MYHERSHKILILALSDIVLALETYTNHTLHWVNWLLAGCDRVIHAADLAAIFSQVT
jgi:hypothetical protein